MTATVREATITRPGRVPLHLRLLAPHSAAPGDLVWFRYNGTGDPKPVRVQPRGPLHQCYVCFTDERGVELPNGRLAVNDGRELWTEAP